MLAIIDMDKFVYQAGYASQTRLGDTIIPSHVKVALHVINFEIQKVLKNTKATDYIGYITSNDKSNFRFETATIQDYKGNRKGLVKPVHYHAIRKYLVEHKKTQEVSGIEADDAVRIKAESFDHPEKYIICSEDKDLMQIQGWHYNPRHETTEYVGHFKGQYNFWLQALMGDRVDNIPGLPGVGIVTAKKLLNEVYQKFNPYIVWEPETKGPIVSEVNYLDFNKELINTVIEAYFEYLPNLLIDEVFERLNEVCSLLYLLRTNDDKWTPIKEYIE